MLERPNCEAYGKFTIDKFLIKDEDVGVPWLDE